MFQKDHTGSAIAHQSSGCDEFPVIVDRRQSRTLRQGIDANPVGGHERVANNIERIRATPKRLEGGLDILSSPKPWHLLNKRRLRIWLGVFPVQRLNACVNALTS
jgi:hypothetical protein